MKGCGPPSEVQVVDLFCGAGGASTGFEASRSAGLRYRVVGAVDVDPHACDTFERMHGVAPLRTGVQDLAQPRALRDAAAGWSWDPKAPSLLIGCAPCQGFSSHRKKDPRRDRRNDLLGAFAEVVVALRPDLVVMENVPEMFGRKHWPHYEGWRDAVEAAGYTVRARIYNLAGFGVPQERFRAVVVAARDWTRFGMPTPTHDPASYVTVRDAIGGLPPLTAGGVDPRDPMHRTSRHRPSTVELLSLIPPAGGSRRSLPDGVGPRCLDKVDGFRDVYGRLWWDRPAVAITARCRTPSCGRFTHPEQHRGLSVREAALLQGFPPDFMFEGPFDDKFKQVGNAVSPIFGRALAEHLARERGLDHGPARRLDPADDMADDVVAPLTKSFSSRIASLKRRARDGAGGPRPSVRG